MKCFVDQHRQLDIDTLTHGKPVALERTTVAAPKAPNKQGRIKHLANEAAA